MKRGSYDQRLQVKQMIGIVTGGNGKRWNVLKTGDDRWYLFCLIDAHDCDVGLHHPVRKTDLVPDVRRALAAGCVVDLTRPLCGSR